ncbi:BTAD domain-containing putative transcriptional regulator [Paractinoplanes ferrugineus]|uniref:SARP family transcriptional regulator n=1 Tax=Paractinoplanes ferrugineus TaxID=113564 RepID=A0A919J135_9ACTN|nr:AfsR/SARP family transcriptional regulator [Actinoplanes ferrugineus]GIE12806.1 SARP family transcriptional regulator [Actinoplanes ferrugineus]
MRVTFGVLGPVMAWDDTGPIALRGPRHRAVLARLVAARGRVVPLGDLVTDLWVAPPAKADAAVRTFVAALRRAIEPSRPPRAPARLLVTEGPGYALRADPDTVDAWRFEAAVRTTDARRLAEALSWWRGPAYADFAADPWTGAERARLAELRLRAVEQLGEARLAAGDPASAIPDLDAHATEHPWREQAWRLLALALYRTGRQPEALAVLRRARALLAGQLGLDPTPELRHLEQDILRQAPHLTLAQTTRTASGDPTAGQVWAQAAADYDRIVAAGARARLDSTVEMLRTLAVTGGGGLVAARRHRTAAIAAAEELGDPVLTARVIGAYDVPAIWTRSDDPGQAATVVAAARRALRLVPADDRLRARLMATIAIESRGAAAGAGPRAFAEEAVATARGQDDPGLLAFALNGLFMQTAHRTGLAGERDRIGAELVELAGRHGLVTYEVLGRLIRLQACAALGDPAAAEGHAAAADDLAGRHELPLVAVFTTWFRAMRAEDPEHAYRQAAGQLDDSGMPGLAGGLRDLALLTVRVRAGRPARPGDFGPYEPWARPYVLLAEGRTEQARQALLDLPAPPPDLMAEVLWCLTARAATQLDDQATVRRAGAALWPARHEVSAGSGLVSLGRVSQYAVNASNERSA